MADAQCRAADLGPLRALPGLYCAEGEPRAAESALAIQKAMPTGGHFNESFGETGTCAARGFLQTAAGPDECTPAVSVFFQSPGDATKYQNNSVAHLKAYAQRYELAFDTAYLMMACNCVDGSPLLLKADHQGQCKAGLKDAIGAWVHRDPWNNHQLMCDQGPFVFATRALATLKSSPQLPMHFRDQISPLGCAKMGEH